MQITKRQRIGIYLVLGLFLGVYALFLNQKRSAEAQILIDVERTTMSMLTVENRLVEKSANAVFYKCENTASLQRKEIMTVIKLLEMEANTLYKTFCSARDAALTSLEKAEKEGGRPEKMDFEGIKAQRAKLYAVFEKMESDSLFTSVFSKKPKVKPKQLEVIQSAFPEQVILMGRDALLQDLENSLIYMQHIHTILDELELDKEIRILPMISFEKNPNVGDKVKGEIFLAQYATHDIQAVVGKDTLQSVDGLAHYTKTFWTPGIKTLPVEILFRNPFTGKVDKFSKSFKIRVIE